MKNETKQEGHQELAETAAPAPTNGYKIVGYDGTHAHVLATNRTYDLTALTPDQVGQLIALGWPHIERT